MTISKTRYVLLGLALVALGCGSAAQEKKSAQPNIEAKPILRAGTSGNYPPISVWKGTRAQGFAPELLDAFATAERSEISWTKFAWGDLVPDMRAGRFDVAADGITVVPEKSIVGRFSVPIARGAAVLLLKRPTWARAIKADADPKATARALDRKELRIAVYPGGRLDAVTRSLFRAAKVVPLRDTTKARDMIARGEIDAAMSDTFEVLRWSEGLSGVERIGPLGHDTMAFWLSAERADLAEKLDGWLLDQEARGGLGKARLAVIGPGGGTETARPSSALIASSVELFGLAPVVAAARKRAGRPVVDRADDDRFVAAAASAVAKAASDHGLAAPPPARVEALFRAQVDASNALAERAALDGGEPAVLDLDKEVRPAIQRIVARMAFVLVRFTARAPDAVTAEVQEDLVDTGLDRAMIDRLATALSAFAQPSTQ